jgi:hypothetical protein
LRINSCIILQIRTGEFKIESEDIPICCRIGNFTGGLFFCPQSGAHPNIQPSQLKGQALFNLRCAQCHALVPETTIVGPSLANIATRAETRVEGYDAQSYIETSILIPGDYVVEGFEDIMPKNFGKDLTSEELDDVVQYLLLQK